MHDGAWLQRSVSQIVRLFVLFFLFLGRAWEHKAVYWPIRSISP